MATPGEGTPGCAALHRSDTPGCAALHPGLYSSTPAGFQPGRTPEGWANRAPGGVFGTRGVRPVESSELGVSDGVTLSAQPFRRAALLERLQGGLLFLLDVEELVQFRDLEDLVDLRVDVAQDQPAAGRLQFLVERDQLPQR